MDTPSPRPERREPAERDAGDPRRLQRLPIRALRAAYREWLEAQESLATAH